MSSTSHVRFVNDYSRAQRDLRLKIDALFALYHKHSGALGVVSLVGVDSTGTNSTISLPLSPDFSIEDFLAALKSFCSIELAILLVSADDVFPPLVALKLLSELHGKCECIRVSTANMSYEYRTLNRLIEFATVEDRRRDTIHEYDRTREERVAALLAGFMSTLVSVGSVASHGH